MASHRKEEGTSPDSNFSWKDLFRAYWFLQDTSKWRFFFLMAVLFVINFYFLIPPLVVGKIVDFFTTYHPGDPLQAFYLYAFVLGGTFVAVSFIRLSIKNTLGNLQSEVRYQTKVKGFQKLLDFSLAWHLEEGSGTKAQKVINGVEAYRTLHQRLTNEIVRSLSAIIGVIAVFIFLRPQYVLFFLGYTAGFWIILLFYFARIQKENNSFYSSVEKAGGSYVEGLSNILTIKTLGAGVGFEKHIAAKEYKTKEHELILRKLYNGLWKLFQGFNGVCYGVFLYMVGRDVIAGYISPGSLVVFYGYLQNLIGNAADMIDTYETVLSSKSAIGRMMSVFWSHTITAAGTQKLSPDWDAIVLDKANFTYVNSQVQDNPSLATGKKEKTLKSLSLTIPRYAKIGVVGKTGSGKSTVAKILAGLYPLSSGTYTIGSTSFYDLQHEEQTHQLTLVLQETEVFNFSLGDNITLMRETEPRLLQKAIAIAQLEELVAKLPEGIETVVGEKGYHLSGGERQRVGIARAICKDSPILIFDEATSSLDSKTELRIQQALETQLEDKTIIIIAHRVSTLEKTDIIYVFDNGHIVEEGTFKELSKNNKSKFYELYHTRSADTGAAR